MTLDFSPRPRGFNAPAARRSFDETADMLRSRAFDVCRHLLPAGKRNAGEYECGSVGGERGKSLKVNLATGVWKDFSGGEGGHDLIALWAEARGIKMKEAKEEAEAWLGIDRGSSTVERRVLEPIEARTPQAGGSTPPPGANPPEDDPDWWRKVKKTASWDYCDADGVVFGSVFRFDAPGRKKEIRPWNGKDWKSPDGIRPLYNLPAIVKSPRSAWVVLVEGEKCAEAIKALGRPDLIATTCWGGAAAAKRTDWSVLRGRHVLRWPDNDPPNPDPGKKTGRQVWIGLTDELLHEAQVASVREVDTADRPPKWDAADATIGERLALLEEAMKAPASMETDGGLEVAGMSAYDLFWGKEAPPIRWLVDKVVPYGRGGLFAAAGDTGKGMMLLDLAVKVATPETPGGFDANPVRFLGHAVNERGAAVILSAEDDRAEVHRRLLSMSADEQVWRRLFVVSYPDLRGRYPTFIEGDVGKIQLTQEFKRMLDELGRIPDLKLVVVDPLAAFAGVDMTSSAAAQRTGAMVDDIAKSLDCTCVAAHHMVKGDRKAPIKTLADARREVSGAGQLLSAVRFAYAIFQPDEEAQKKTLALLDREWTPHAVFYGGVVKSNAPADRDQHCLVRDAKTGLLQRVDLAPVRRAKEAEEAAKRGDTLDLAVRMLVEWVKFFNDNGRDVTAAGKDSYITRRADENAVESDVYAEMPAEWKALNRKATVAALNRAKQLKLVETRAGGRIYWLKNPP